MNLDKRINPHTFNTESRSCAIAHIYQSEAAQSNRKSAHIFPYLKIMMCVVRFSPDTNDTSKRS